MYYFLVDGILIYQSDCFSELLRFVSWYERTHDGYSRLEVC